MRMLSNYIFALAVTAIGLPVHAAPTPLKVSIPSHTVWCVETAQAIEIQPGDKEFSEILFNTLYQKLEVAAIGAKLASIGVPYLEALPPVAPNPTPAPPAPLPVSPTPPPVGPGAAAPAPIRQFVRVCAAVPPQAPATPSGVTKIDTAAVDLYAVLCPVNDDTECKEAIGKLLISAHAKTDDEVRNVAWHTNQPTSTDGSKDGLQKSLIDYKFRPLKMGQTSANDLTELTIISTPVP